MASLNTEQVSVVGAGIAKLVVFHQIAVGKYLAVAKSTCDD